MLFTKKIRFCVYFDFKVYTNCNWPATLKMHPVRNIIACEVRARFSSRTP